MIKKYTVNRTLTVESFTEHQVEFIEEAVRKIEKILPDIRHHSDMISVGRRSFDLPEARHKMILRVLVAQNSKMSLKKSERMTAFIDALGHADHWSGMVMRVIIYGKGTTVIATLVLDFDKNGDFLRCTET